MKNLRVMLACLAIGSTALGCAFETAPEPDTPPQSSMAASQGEDSVRAGPELAAYWYLRGKKFVALAEAGYVAAYDKAKEALRTCIDMDRNMTECFLLMDVVNRSAPGCLSCGVTAANVPTPNGPAVATLP